MLFLRLQKICSCPVLLIWLNLTLSPASLNENAGLLTDYEVLSLLRESKRPNRKRKELHALRTVEAQVHNAVLLVMEIVQCIVNAKNTSLVLLPGPKVLRGIKDSP